MAIDKSREIKRSLTKERCRGVALAAEVLDDLERVYNNIVHNMLSNKGKQARQTCTEEEVIAIEVEFIDSSSLTRC